MFLIEYLKTNTEQLLQTYALAPDSNENGISLHASDRFMSCWKRLRCDAGAEDNFRHSNFCSAFFAMHMFYLIPTVCAASKEKKGARRGMNQKIIVGKKKRMEISLSR